MQESKEIYENFDKISADYLNKIIEIKKVLTSDENIKPNKEFAPDGEAPYGFYTKDYGVEGNREGIQKEDLFKSSLIIL